MFLSNEQLQYSIELIINGDNHFLLSQFWGVEKSSSISTTLLHPLALAVAKIVLFFLTANQPLLPLL
ncbi:hypothetical protein DXZ20_27260 [Leptolyngbyaceae cyanobacterium CCMR0081]|uniref:Uncharacterized protein n=1 Tax=Adonisia turfae CCMR0081 TaxID=2292702 RepID=A0A6M0RSQ6_9CYAN|nr:hypothetical protein [Adonisia turfae CCMR0081]